MSGGLGTVFILLLIVLQNMVPSLGERQVLIRDRLVYVLCDQIDSYLKTGKLPKPVMKMPEKFKQVKPVSGAIKGFTIIFPSGANGKRKREAIHSHPILDLLF